ncbi:amidohydrolase [Shewanella waksmanii]|uniref:amidohydrolase n=1 Tax=Shewanella waksmanii TaxID=213783 RepID=UPI00048F7FB7|nr:amidohydrolase [Shewanella waksmanii]
MKTIISLAAAVFSLSSLSVAAHDMVPAPAQTQDILIKNATVHSPSKGVLTNTDVLIQQGKITAVGPTLNAADATVIDATNKQVYPGVIALDTSLGLVEVEMMRPSNDVYEVGQSNPQIIAVSAYNPDSEIIPTVRVNGITHAQVVPQGDLLAGQSSLVSLDSWTIEDALVPATQGFHLYWPSIRRLSQDKDKRKEQLDEYQQQLKQIEQMFADGQRYHLANRDKQVSKIDLRWQALQPLYQRQAQLFVHANKQLQIEEAVALAKQYDFKLVIVGGYDSWRLADLLNEVNASVVYTRTFSLPMRHDEPLEMSFKIPSLLAEAEIPFALGFSSDWNSRNLPYAAGQAAAYGLTQQQALKSITLDAAKILGVTDMGDIASGYRGNVIIAEGDLLDPMTSRIEQLFIDGRQIDLNNRHQQLYQKYLKR